MSQQDADVIIQQESGTPGETHHVIPVTAEELEISKERVTTGKVRLTKQVTERTETIDEPGFREEVQVERVLVGRFVEKPPEIYVDGDTTIIPVVEEVLVVVKRLRIKEEIRVTRKRKEVQDPQTVKLRSEDVKVERISTEGDNPSGETGRKSQTKQGT